MGDRGVIRITYEKPQEQGWTKVVVQEGTVVLDVSDRLKSKCLTEPVVVLVPTVDLILADPDLYGVADEED